MEVLPLTSRRSSCTLKKSHWKVPYICRLPVLVPCQKIQWLTGSSFSLMVLSTGGTLGWWDLRLGAWQPLCCRFLCIPLKNIPESHHKDHKAVGAFLNLLWLSFDVYYPHTIFSCLLDELVSCRYQDGILVWLEPIKKSEAANQDAFQEAQSSFIAFGVVQD